MSTRRSGAACETAQNSVAPPHPLRAPPVGLIVRLDIERQKLFSAMQLSAPPASVVHWLYTFTAPLITTSPGSRPRPATSV